MPALLSQQNKRLIGQRFGETNMPSEETSPTLVIYLYLIRRQIISKEKKCFHTKFNKFIKISIYLFF